MAHPRAVAVRRQVAEKLLREATQEASKDLGIEFREPVTPPHRHPDLYAAELVESVTAFVRNLHRAHAPSKRKAS